MAGDDPNKWLELMKWTMKHGGENAAPSSTEEAKPMSQEDREFLERVMKEGVMDETERIRDILRILDGEPPQDVLKNHDQNLEYSEEDLVLYKEALLDELLTRIDQIDNANNLVKMDGLPVLQRVMSGNDRPDTRSAAAEVVSVVVQNNPFSQDEAVAKDVLSTLLELAQDADAGCRAKALLAISCLVRQHQKAEAQLLQSKALDILLARLQESEIKLQRKALFFLRYLIRNSDVTTKKLIDSGVFIPTIATFITSDDIDLSEGSLEALVEVAAYGSSFRAACQTPEIRSKIQECIEQIHKLSGEEREMAQETLKRAEAAKQVLGH